MYAENENEENKKVLPLPAADATPLDATFTNTCSLGKNHRHITQRFDADLEEEAVESVQFRFRSQKNNDNG